ELLVALELGRDVIAGVAGPVVAATGVGGNTVGRRAEQAAERQLRPLGEQAPKRDVDRTEHAQERTATPEQQQVAEDQLPALLDREGASPSQPRREQLFDPAPQPKAAGVAGIRVADSDGTALVDNAD